MKNSKIKAGVTLVEVADTIKQRIIAGTYPRGSKLPVREKLKVELKTTFATIQRGFDRLIADGYVYANGSRGTFVAEFPPVDYNYGILFLHVPGDEAWVKYWERMQEEAEKWNENTNYTFKFYYGLNKKESHLYQEQVLDDLREQRIGGVIFAGGIDGFDQNFVSQIGNIWSAICYVSTNKSPFAAMIDKAVFCKEAVAKLHELKRRKIAIITCGEYNTYLKDNFIAEFKRLNMEYNHNLVLHGGDILESFWVERLVTLLCQLPDEKRPDGIIVTDDNLRDGVCKGLEKTNFLVGKDLDVIIHANFPLQKADDLPVYRLGFDVNETIGGSLKALLHKKQGLEKDELVIPAIFGDINTGKFETYFDQEDINSWDKI